MNDPQPLKTIGDYQLIRLIGKGGMGEVFLAFDPICGRHVALKQMREEMRKNTTLQERFLREARIASQLSHPSIIPIYTIHQTPEAIFYTMPQIEGETLKDILQTSVKQAKQGDLTHPIGSSIPSCIRIFLSVCEAVAYTHAKGILHRDLKPENIIVGKYGEVLILDWGLADFIGEDHPIYLTNKQTSVSQDLTLPGKIPGTLSYLAPERLQGAPSSVLTDLYALGVILYQLLTLKLPFYRPSIQIFRKTVDKEKCIHPNERAPYREIPSHLADIVKKTLDADPCKRYQTMESLICELKSYIEGRPEWIPAAALNISSKSDWEFQENILLTKHMAIAGSLDVMEWVSLMISKGSFSGNTKIQTKIRLKASGGGIGFLLGIPEAPERRGFEEGYCLWIGSEKNPACRLFHSNIQVMEIPHVYLKQEAWQEIHIEKIDNHLRFYLDQELQCHYISRIPLKGTHIGLLYRDGDFELTDLSILSGSQNVMVNCLAVPDAFLAHRNYVQALCEYRRIAYSFSGRAEGREALFRAGITLLEEAGIKKTKKERERLSSLALDEFGKLRLTPGAPLEYLGKALVYQFLDEIEEEIKCLELCLRKYPKHPLLKEITEHIVFRLHETSSKDRIAAFYYALLALRYLPSIFESKDHLKLLTSLKAHLEPLPFLVPLDQDPFVNVAIQLAFWLGKPLALIEIVESDVEAATRANGLFALLFLGYEKWIEKSPWKTSVEGVLNFEKKGSTLRTAFYLCDRALKENRPGAVLPFLSVFKGNLLIDTCAIKAHLFLNEWSKAEALLKSYPKETLLDSTSPLFPLIGCLLWRVQGKKSALSHFSSGAGLPHPTTTTLLSRYLYEEIDFSSSLLFWEKIQLFHYLELSYHCNRNPKLAKTCSTRLKQEMKRVQIKNPYP